MKIIINVENNRADFFIKLLENLKFVTIEEIIDEVTNDEKEFIEYRIAHHKANRDKAILWDDLKKQLSSE